jgi:tetratricopeptide (TPR) repeat protein
MKKRLFILIAALMAACTQESKLDLENAMNRRPDQENVIFDYVGLMEDVTESTTRYLENIRDRYQIEILVAALPSLENQYTVNQAAVEIFSNWKIGKDYQSRGILLLLVDDVKAVKLEVGFELEDVFTDMFTGFIEDRQLQPRYSADELEIGLIAVMEELEARAQTKFKGGYTLAHIQAMDARYLSQGAGARRNLTDYRAPIEFSGTVNRDYPAGRTPKEAWLTMIQRWRDKTRDPYLEIFTPLARIAYRDHTNMPDSHFEKEYRAYKNKNYRIRADGDYAVVYFGKKKGWDNAPFLLCRTREGWQFDLVHQRRFIRMGPAPAWGVEFSEHPHMGLLMDTFQFRGQDIPLEGDDLYTTDRETDLANRILVGEIQYKANPNDFDTALRLGRLYTIVSMSRKAIKVLKKARKLNADDPRPHKYLAICHVNAHYQYDAALKALKDYLKREPGDAFGYNFAGYIHYHKKAYAKAADAFEKTLSLDPDSCYAHFYLTCTYARLYDQALKLDPQRNTYKERYHHHRERTLSYQQHPLRVRQLNKWLSKS